MKVKHNVPLADGEKKRRDWSELEKMKVNSVVDVRDGEAWTATAKYARLFAARKGWEVTCHWLDAENIGRIRRTA